MKRWLLLLLFSCSMHRPHTESEITAALHQYDRLIQKVDGDSIALLYTTDGELGTVAKGRDSIRKFLASFKNINVLLQASASDSVSIKGDGATQKGSYKQVAVVSDKDTLHLHGTFAATWQWIAGEGWRIKRMNTTPDN